MFLEVRQEVWVPSSCHGDLREPLILVLGSQDSFGVVRGLSGFLSRHCSGKGIIWIEGRITWYFSSCSGKLGVPLELRRVLRDCSCCLREARSLFELQGAVGIPLELVQGLGPHVELRRETQGSFPALTGISGSLWRLPWRVRCCFVLGHGTLLPSRDGKGVSGLLSS